MIAQTQYNPIPPAITYPAYGTMPWIHGGNTEETNPSTSRTAANVNNPPAAAIQEIYEEILRDVNNVKRTTEQLQSATPNLHAALRAKIAEAYRLATAHPVSTLTAISPPRRDVFSRRRTASAGDRKSSSIARAYQSIEPQIYKRKENKKPTAPVRDQENCENRPMAAKPSYDDWKERKGAPPGGRQALTAESPNDGCSASRPAADTPTLRDNSSSARADSEGYKTSVVTKENSQSIASKASARKTKIRSTSPLSTSDNCEENQFHNREKSDELPSSLKPSRGERKECAGAHPDESQSPSSKEHNHERPGSTPPRRVDSPSARTASRGVTKPSVSDNPYQSNVSQARDAENCETKQFHRAETLDANSELPKSITPDSRANRSDEVFRWWQERIGSTAAADVPPRRDDPSRPGTASEGGDAQTSEGKKSKQETSPVGTTERCKMGQFQAEEKSDVKSELSSRLEPKSDVDRTKQKETLPGGHQSLSNETTSGKLTLPAENPPERDDPSRRKTVSKSEAGSIGTDKSYQSSTSRNSEEKKNKQATSPPSSSDSCETKSFHNAEKDVNPIYFVPTSLLSNSDGDREEPNEASPDGPQSTSAKSTDGGFWSSESPLVSEVVVMVARLCNSEAPDDVEKQEEFNNMFKRTRMKLRLDAIVKLLEATVTKIITAKKGTDAAHVPKQMEADLTVVLGKTVEWRRPEIMGEPTFVLWLFPARHTPRESHT